MKKLKDWTKLRKGRVYNSVYVGSNTAYARINGKSTFRVLEMKPQLKTVDLFTQFGDPKNDKICDTSPSTYGDPAIAFSEYDLFEPTDESEWFKKSTKVTSLTEALDRNVITLEDIKEMARPSNRSPFVPSFGSGHKMDCVHCRFNVEDKTSEPLLQAVFVVWPTWQELKADFKKFGFSVET